MKLTLGFVCATWSTYP